MPLRFLLRYFVNTNSEKVIEKLSESYPMRRAAQLTAYVFFRGKALGEDTLKKIQESESVHGVKSFKKTFTDEVKEGLKKLNEETKKK